MPHPDDLALMARTIKILADRGRLAILGLLAERPRTLEDLVRNLPSFSSLEIERRVRMLEDADWIGVEDAMYSLRSESLTTLRAAVARMETPRPPDTTGVILRAFFDKDGRLRGLPAQRAKRDLVLGSIAERYFAAGRSYDEREVNDLLASVHDDPSMLRRAMLAAGILDGGDSGYSLSQRRHFDSSRQMTDGDSGVTSASRNASNGDY